MDEQMPVEFVENRKRWEELHPQWIVWDWTDSSSLPEFRNQDLIDSAEDIIPDDAVRFKTDVIRLELLYRFGGVYVDTDTFPFRTIGPLIENVSCFAAYSPQTSPEGEHPITQAVIGSEQRHPFIDECLDNLGESIDTFKGYTLAKLVGPWHVSRTYKDYNREDVRIFNHEEFYREWVYHHWNTEARKRGEGIG